MDIQLIATILVLVLVGMLWAQIDGLSQTVKGLEHDLREHARESRKH